MSAEVVAIVGFVFAILGLGFWIGRICPMRPGVSINAEGFGYETFAGQGRYVLTPERFHELRDAEAKLVKVREFLADDGD